MPSEEESVKREMKIHGQRWGSFHHHYFASPKVAEPLVEAILSAVDAARPEVIADLGGGTGFLLKELLRRRPLKGVRLVDVDVSDLQLSACDDERIERLLASAASVTRRDLGAEDQRLLLAARSLLHYFGCSGLQPLLRHLRGQLHEGERFVHQSACFADDGDAACLNRVYGMMKTEKWYFTIDELEAALKEAGFSLCEVRAAPPLRLDSCDHVQMTDSLPRYMALNPDKDGNFTIEPTRIERNGTEWRTTTMVWDLGDLSSDDNWSVSFDALFCWRIPADAREQESSVKSEVNYIDPETGDRMSVPIPEGGIRIEPGAKSAASAASKGIPGFSALIGGMGLLAAVYLFKKR